MRASHLPCRLLPGSSLDRRDKVRLPGLLFKDTNAIREGFTLVTSSSPKGLTSNAITLEVRISACEFGERQSIASSVANLCHEPYGSRHDSTFLQMSELSRMKARTKGKAKNTALHCSRSLHYNAILIFLYYIFTKVHYTPLHQHM